MNGRAPAERYERLNGGWGPGHAIAADQGEAALAVSVIALAWNDALAGRIQPSGRYSSHIPMRAERDEALAFLTRESGPWAQARAMWCDAAGIDPDALRHRALRAVGLV